MKKYIKYIIILIVIIEILFFINYFFRPSVDDQIKSYLINIGYKESDEYDNLYVKNDSSSKTHSFSLNDYTLMLNQDDSLNDMFTSLNATYNYKKENIIYSYRVNYSNTINVWFKGTYENEKFTCEKEFSSTELTENDKTSICNLANSSIKIFELEAKTLFSKYKFVDYIKNK